MRKSVPGLDLEQLLGDTLGSWRAARSSELAAIVEDLSALIAPALPPIAGKTRAERHAAWRARAEARLTSDLPALLAAVAQGTSIETTDQLEVLADWPADPRMTELAVRLLSAPPYATSSGTQKVWRRLFNLVEVHGDPRASAALGALPMGQIFRGGDRGQAMRDRAAKVIATIATEHPVPQLPPAEAAVIAKLADRIREATASGRALFEQVRADPKDAQALSVYTDWLLERGFVKR